jgi:CheY-like chemotaxis protein
MSVPGARILVVEDVRVIADAVVRRLRGQGHLLEVLHDGPSAVAAVAVPVSGVAWLLVLALAGPDGVVAPRDVDRYQQTGQLDVYYLADLSEDAVPALADLPEPVRGCVLAARMPVPGDDPWYGWNLARSRAAAVPGVNPVSPRWPPASPCPS